MALLTSHGAELRRANRPVDLRPGTPSRELPGPRATDRAPRAQPPAHDPRETPVVPRIAGPLCPPRSGCRRPAFRGFGIQVSSRLLESGNGSQVSHCW